MKICKHIHYQLDDTGNEPVQGDETAIVKSNKPAVPKYLEVQYCTLLLLLAVDLSEFESCNTQSQNFTVCKADLIFKIFLKL